MAWSGKQALLDEFVPRFHDPQRCIASLEKYIRGARILDDGRARAWVEKDLALDQELATIADPEDYALGPSRFELNGCYHCSGGGAVRLDVDTRHPDFGKVKPCPACAGGGGDRSSHCLKCAEFSRSFSPDFATESAPVSWRNRCMKCGRFEDELAGEKCRHPRWHLPNARTPSESDAGRRRDYVAELARQMKMTG